MSISDNFKRILGDISEFALFILLWIITLPFYLILKTIVTIWQPYFYRKQKAAWNKYYQDCLRKGIFVDYPPREGTLFGVIRPWGSKIDEDEDDDIFD